MKKDYTDIIAIIDRSGSMQDMAVEVVGSFTKFVKDQQEEKGTCTLTLVQFDDAYEVNYIAKDINDVPDIKYIPRGMTAMYDAIGKTIISAGERLANMDEAERPKKVIVLIQTDGYENASKEYSASAIKKMITTQEKDYAWEFVFLGANINAKDTADMIGIKRANAMTYDPTAFGTKCAMASVSKNLKSFRSGSTASMSYDTSDYANQEAEQ